MIIFTFSSFKKISDLFVKFKKEMAIKNKLAYYGISNYTLLDDYSININSHIDLNDIDLSGFDIKINEVDGSFSANNCKINDEVLKYLPKIVVGRYSLEGNFITSLKNGPTHVYDDLIIQQNPLISYENNLEEVGYIYLSKDNEWIAIDLPLYNSRYIEEKTTNLYNQFNQDIPDKSGKDKRKKI